MTNRTISYLKLFIPIPVTILLTVLPFLLFENQADKVYVLICGAFVKGGLLIYYLRVGNDKTPMLNTLTIILLAMLVGEYLFNSEMTGGQNLFIISNMAFALVYLMRQKVKAEQEKLASLKSIAVFVYALTNIIYVYGILNLMPIVVGNLFLASVYFYDRVLKIELEKKAVDTTLK